MIPAWYQYPILEGDSGPAVVIVQRKLGAPQTGLMDLTTVARVRGFQRASNLAQTGEVDAATAEALGEKASAGQPPVWFHRPLTLGATGPDVEALALALGEPPTRVFSPSLVDALRRFQASVNIGRTGVLDSGTAVALSDRSA